MRTSFLIYKTYCVKGLRTIKAVEVGVYKGDNAFVMLKDCPTLNLILVDNYEVDSEKFTKEDGSKFSYSETESFIATMNDKLKDYKDRYTFIRDSSIKAASYYPDNYFDYVYIDGSHDYKSVSEDVKAWYPKLREFGMLAGHDMWSQPIIDAVIDYCRPDNLELYGVFRCAQGYVNRTFVQTMDWWIWKLSDEARAKILRGPVKE